MSRKRVAVLISGRGSNMAALIEAAKDKDYPAEIALVLSNRPDAGGLATARSAGIATEVVDHTLFGKDRTAFDCTRCRLCWKNTASISFVSPASCGCSRPNSSRIGPGACSISTPLCCPRSRGSTPTNGRSQRTRKIHGATVHFVVAELDSGPIIAQGAVAVHAGDSEATLAARVLKIEHQIYPLALKLLAEGRIQVENGRCLIDGAPVPDTTTLVRTE